MRGDIFDKLTDKNMKSNSGNELVESLLNIRSRLEDYLQMVAKDDHGAARRLDEPQPRQLQPSQSFVESSYDSVRVIEEGGNAGGATTLEPAIISGQSKHQKSPQFHNPPSVYDNTAYS